MNYPIGDLMDESARYKFLVGRRSRPGLLALTGRL